MPDRCRGPRHERVSQELWTLATPVSPGLFAAPFRDRRNASVFLEVIGRRGAFPLCAEGDEEAGGKDGPSAWQGVKQRDVGMALGVRRDGCVAVRTGAAPNVPCSAQHRGMGDSACDTAGEARPWPPAGSWALLEPRARGRRRRPGHGNAHEPGHVGPEPSEPTSLRARANRIVPCAEARATEELEAGNRHARVGAGGRDTGVPTAATDDET
jgi:hypothetical protein